MLSLVRSKVRVTFNLILCQNLVSLSLLLFFSLSLMSAKLFSSYSGDVKKVARDSYLIENFFSAEKAVEVLASVDSDVQFLSREDPRMQFRIYGKTVQLPRDKAVYGEVVVDEDKKERVEPFYKYAKDTPPVESWKVMFLQVVQDQI